MNDRELETRLRARYRVRAGTTEPAPLTLRRDVAAIPRTASVPRRPFGRGRGMTLLVAAAVLVGGGALAAGSGILRLPSRVPPVPAPSVDPLAIRSPDATSARPSASASATPVPSPTPAPITWTEASLEEDWPSPVRAEPPGRPIGVPMFLKVVVEGTNCPGDCLISTDWGDPWVDPIGDTGSADNHWADIDEVTFCGPTCLSIGLVSDPPPAADPGQLWIAYGVVVDSDGDGLPDWRYGVDNVPLDKTDSQPDRWWRTNLHTGRTDWAVGDHINLRPSRTIFWGDWPVGNLNLRFGAETAGVGTVGGLPKRFYAWASVIKDGRVVATDHAPDAGWLIPSADAKP